MSDNQKQKIIVNTTLVIVVIGFMNGLMPFATDLYLPAFSSMAKSLNTSVGFIAMTMSSFFFGSCIGQLINGPILDKYGRKYPMMAGLTLFSVTSVWCGLVQYFEVLILLRFFQAIGISMCNVGSKAIVRDIFPPKETARIFSILGLIMGISPIIAPTVGSWLLLGFGWRSIFYFLAVFSFLLIIVLWQFLPNTLQKDDDYAFTLSNISSKYLVIIRNKKYLGYSFVTAMASAVLFSWISSSSFIFIELLDLSETQFGLVFAGTSASLIMSNQVNIFLLKKMKSQDIAIAAVIMEVVVSAYLFYVVAYHFSVTLMIVGMCLLLFFLHLITTNTMALGLNQIEKDLGIASAFMGSLRMALSAIVTLIISYFLTASAFPMVIAITIISVMSLILQIGIKRNSVKDLFDNSIKRH
jgi:DHA1 family bicyclomycin/chloramphenicol resistance-like MFS transporter